STASQSPGRGAPGFADVGSRLFGDSGAWFLPGAGFRQFSFAAWPQALAFFPAAVQPCRCAALLAGLGRSRKMMDMIAEGRRQARQDQLRQAPDEELDEELRLLQRGRQEVKEE
ncbi:unnamed protein product, partial [Effrenium voratum]